MPAVNAQNEKKWIHSFECVTNTIFRTSLSEYDQVLLEEYKTNGMAESRFVRGRYQLAVPLDK